MQMRNEYTYRSQNDKVITFSLRVSAVKKARNFLNYRIDPACPTEMVSHWDTRKIDQWSIPAVSTSVVFVGVEITSARPRISRIAMRPAFVDVAECTGFLKLWPRRAKTSCEALSSRKKARNYIQQSEYKSVKYAKLLRVAKICKNFEIDNASCALIYRKVYPEAGKLYSFFWKALKIIDSTVK